MSIIQDGAGQGYGAKVNSANRLWTFADSVPSGVIAAADKKMWLVITGSLTYTTANKSAALYLLYTGPYKLIIPQYNLTVGLSTGGANGTVFTTRANPTSGTIVSDATQTTVNNRNFSGTSGSLTGSQFKGGEGKTVTDGTEIGSLTFAGEGVNQVDLGSIPFILETGNSISLEVTPPPGNTSQVNRVSIICYELVVD
jgi:hypothetical protein